MEVLQAKMAAQYLKKCIDWFESKNLFYQSCLKKSSVPKYILKTFYYNKSLGIKWNSLEFSNQIYFEWFIQIFNGFEYQNYIQLKRIDNCVIKNIFYFCNPDTFIRYIILFHNNNWFCIQRNFCQFSIQEPGIYKQYIITVSRIICGSRNIGYTRIGYSNTIFRKANVRIVFEIILQQFHKKTVPSMKCLGTSASIFKLEGAVFNMLDYRLCQVRLDQIKIAILPQVKLSQS